MATQSEQNRTPSRGPVQFAEEIWGKISNDSRVRHARNKTRKFISNGPFIAIVISAGGESKPVAFAVLPVLGLAQAGRVVQAIEEATSGKPLSINTVLTVLQSLGAVSVPGMVVGSVVSGAVNAVNLLVNGSSHQTSESKTPTPDAGTPATAGSIPQESQADILADDQAAKRDWRGTQRAIEGAKAESCDSKPLESGIKDGALSRETHTIEFNQGSVDEKEVGERGYWYKVIDGTQNPFKPKL